jgi:hypothetical protein
MIHWETVRHQVAIAGRVVDAQLSQPLRGVLVRITSGPVEFMSGLQLRALQYGEDWVGMIERPDRTMSAGDGHFHFIDLPNGHYTLLASLPGTGSRYGTVQAQPTVSRGAGGNIVRVTVDMILPITTIKGKVTGSGGSPLSMAKIRVLGSGEQTFSDVQGRYLLPGIEAGSRDITVSAQGYQTNTRQITLGAPGSVQTADVALTP